MLFYYKKIHKKNSPLFIYINMYTFTVLEIEILFILFGYLMFKYYARDDKLYIRILVYLSWFLSFGLVIFLPLDIYHVNFL